MQKRGRGGGKQNMSHKGYTHLDEHKTRYRTTDQKSRDPGSRTFSALVCTVTTYPNLDFLFCKMQRLDKEL
jgi:hypothetical protein